jgi:hypothetical protein
MIHGDGCLGWSLGIVSAWSLLEDSKRMIEMKLSGTSRASSYLVQVLKLSNEVLFQEVYNADECAA